MKDMLIAPSYIFSLFFVSSCFFSCEQKKMSQKELVSFVEHSKELNQSQEVNGIKTQIKYYPSRLLVLQELETGSAGDSARLRALKEKYNAQYYFRLSYSKDNKEAIRQLGSFQRYSEMTQVLSFELGKYVNASDEKNDTVPLADYVFDHGYGMSASNDLLLAFKKEGFARSGEININIGEFGLGIGNMRFVFRREDLERSSFLP